jgi:hypothetical protein
MSYILNALKKAEHERSREEPENLDDFVNSGWDPYEKTSKASAGYWLPIAILVIAAGLFYGFSNLSSQLELRPGAAVLPIKERIKERIERIEKPTEETTEEPVAVAVVESTPAVENPGVLSSNEIVAATVVNRALPDLRISGHIFIRGGSRLNRVFVGENTYYVGDNLDPNWVIESINSGSLELRSGTQTTELPLR